MKLTMKTKICSDAVLDNFLLNCMKIKVACKKIVREINDMCEQAEIDRHDETTSKWFCDDSAQL